MWLHGVLTFNGPYIDTPAASVCIVSNADGLDCFVEIGVVVTGIAVEATAAIE